MYCDVQLNPDWLREIPVNTRHVSQVLGVENGSGVWWLPWLGNMLARSLTKLDCGCQQRTDLIILCPKWTAQDSQCLHSLVGFKVHEALPSPGSLYLEGWICWCSSCLRFGWLLPKTSRNTSCFSGWRSAISSTAFTNDVFCEASWKRGWLPFSWHLTM